MRLLFACVLAGSTLTTGCSTKKAPASEVATTGSAVSAPTPPPTAPTPAPPAGLRVERLFADKVEACALMSNRTLRCWGVRRTTPVEIALPADTTQVELDYALDRSGVLWKRTEDLTWTKVDNGRVNVRAFSALENRIVTLHTDGTVQVDRPGRPDYDNKVFTAVVPDLVDITQVLATTLVTAFEINRRGDLTDMGCALDTKGAVHCWTRDLKTFPTKLTGTRLVNAELVCAQNAEKRVYCALPYKSSMERPSYIEGLDGASSIAGGPTEGVGGRICGVFPSGEVRCADMELTMLGDPKIKKAVSIEGLPPVDEIAIARNATYVRLRSGGVLAWGKNDRGQLGDGTWFDRDKPTPVLYLTDTKLPPVEDGFGKEPHESTVEMDWSSLPAGCTRADELVLDEKRKVKVVSAYAVRDESIRLRVSSFRADPAIAYQNLRGSQSQLELNLSRWSAKHDPLPIKKGAYTLDGRPGALGASYDGPAGGKYFKPIYDNVELAVTFVSNDWICGTLTIEKTTLPIAAKIVERKEN